METFTDEADPYADLRDQNLAQEFTDSLPDDNAPMNSEQEAELQRALNELNNQEADEGAGQDFDDDDIDLE